MESETSLRPRPGETAEDTIARVVNAVNKTRTIAIQCPNCSRYVRDVLIEAPATLEISRRITAEVNLETDLYGREVTSDSRGQRYIVSPRVEDFGEILDHHLDARALELDHVDNHGTSDVYVYCPECQGDVAEQFRTVLDEQVSRG